MSFLLRIMHRSNLLSIILASLLFCSSCITTEQIQTTSPRPASGALLNTNTAGMGVFSVTVSTGDTTLPEDVQALRFQVDEILLKNNEGDWQALPAELNSFEILPNRELSKTVLTTRVEPVLYDSIAFSISDLFVLYSENAGGPIAWPKDQHLKEKLSFKPNVTTATRVEIILEPGASLLKDSNCHWFFVPFWTVESL